MCAVYIVFIIISFDNAHICLPISVVTAIFDTNLGYLVSLIFMSIYSGRYPLGILGTDFTLLLFRLMVWPVLI